MKKIILILTISLCTTVTLNAQWWGSSKRISGNGDMTTISRTTSDYDVVKVSGHLKVLLINGKEGALKLKGESNLLPYIETEVNQNTLKIYVKKGYSLNYGRNKEITITVPFATLNQVMLSGSGDIISEDPIKATNFKTAISGSGDIQLVIDATNTSAQVSGSGDLELKGKTNELDINVSGSGDISAYQLIAKQVHANVTGSGDIETHATNSIRARVTGSGDIFFKGNPSKEDNKVVGSGDITRQ
ncbi:head GIN domain-containing protein [Aquimarina intermedia]|uniref:Putative autotransporter adhesin-like protein n=1 Tax=Aquimarina intermedia TaxID=350814 RepID=A0A5S5C6W7_9FLAO|nr:head GIN domain-containing protein [Aquimarina intermedia]TYP75171.1 putative autotransporter adhesin-like protein [Aquimarina intermedia]